MTAQVISTLGVLLVLQLKHFLFDYVLQTTYQATHKGIYGHGAGIRHAGAHGLATGAILLLIGIGPMPVLLMTVAEFVLHYHIDWAKARIVRARHWTPDNRPYWMLVGFDQTLHQATYLAIAAAASTVG